MIMLTGSGPRSNSGREAGLNCGRASCKVARSVNGWKGFKCMISVIAKLPLQDGKVDEFNEAFNEMAVGVGTEEGNFLYSLSYSKKDPNTAVIMERYQDKAALGAHSESDHYKAFGARIAGLLAGAPEVVIMNEIAAA
jgi:quinol monooxygenase YgiN